MKPPPTPPPHLHLVGGLREPLRSINGHVARAAGALRDRSVEPQPNLEDFILDSLACIATQLELLERRLDDIEELAQSGGPRSSSPSPPTDDSTGR